LIAPTMSAIGFSKPAALQPASPITIGGTAHPCLLPVAAKSKPPAVRVVVKPDLKMAARLQKDYLRTAMATITETIFDFEKRGYPSFFIWRPGPESNPPQILVDFACGSSGKPHRAMDFKSE
jgi:hypothetical protein